MSPNTEPKVKKSNGGEERKRAGKKRGKLPEACHWRGGGAGQRRVIGRAGRWREGGGRTVMKERAQGSTEAAIEGREVRRRRGHQLHHD